MSAPLPPFHALALVHPVPRMRAPTRVRACAPRAALARLWTWLMAPLDHGQQGTRAELLARVHVDASRSSVSPR